MKTDIQHPSVYLDKNVIDAIRNTAQEAESLGRLHDEQLAIIYRNKWFKMFVPKQYGGLELTLPEILALEESLSWADGSTAWVVTLCSGAGWFVGFLNPGVADAIFKDELVCLAGSGALTGLAEITDDGFEITGSWKYASGSLHATAFTMNCCLSKNNRQLYNADGSPMYRSFIVNKADVTLQQVWKNMGMVATGSHSFKVDRFRVPADRCFTIDVNNSVLQDWPIYRYPFLQLAETTLAVNISGMTIRFIELAEETIAQGNRNGCDSDKIVKTANATFNMLRQVFFTKVSESWDTLVSQGKIPETLLMEVTEVSHRLVHRSRELINMLYPHCGLRATAIDTEINRVWRNFHTASQHALFKQS